GQLAGLGAKQRALCADDIAQIPVLEGFVLRLADRIARDIELNASRHVLNGGEACLAHHTLEQHAPGHGYLARCGRERGVVLTFAVAMQVARQVGALEVVRKGLALRAQCTQLGATLLDDLVGVLQLFFVHGRSRLVRSRATSLAQANLSFAACLRMRYGARCSCALRDSLFFAASR